ncbi:MAG: hypothetical protein IIC97_03365, partial [Chloroflexi bacterium]|nr:hypothetical protein [Chloroflexota bacterium]
MQTYILKRTLLFVPTLIFVTIVVFVILRVVPGDPALMLISGDGSDEAGQGDITEQLLADMRAKLGTDRNIVVQYADWVWGMLRLDFGMSYWLDTP